MDVLYDNLENFNEESTIAQLRDENRDLKSKLEEYSEALDKLQKEFDRLTSEHKKLEMNYSSLLKTARAEIERKTQIISKLNTEKDAMVLNSIQNRNTPNNRRNAAKDKGVHKINANKTSITNENSYKPDFSHQGTNERKDKKISSENTPNTNSSMKLVDTVNSAGPNTNIEARVMETKENMRLKDDQGKARALITNRRKSMPVFSMECAKFSDDEEAASSAGSAKDYISRDHIEVWDQNGIPNQKPNIGSKISGHYEPVQEALKRQSKQYDSEKYRSRKKFEFAQKYKRNRSSDRIRRGTYGHSEEHFQRQEFERRRKDISPKGRRDSPPRGRRNSPPKSKRNSPLRGRRRSPQAEKVQFHHKSRETQRSNSERYYPEDFDRYKSRSQDKYPMKHKITHDFDQPSSKRMKPDSHYQHEEERWRNERHIASNPLDDLYNMSCQSPDDYNHTEVHPQHQTREIKLHATSKLDDPRISSKKYILRTYNGKSELSTVESANFDAKVIDTTGWKMIERVKMPDALIQRPMFPDKVEKCSKMKIAEPSVHKEEICNEIIKKVPHAHKKKSTDGSENLKDITPECIISESKSTKNDELTKIKMPNSSIQKPTSNDELGLITKMKMPNVIQKRTSNDDDLVKEVYMDIDNPLDDISMESGEIFDFDSPIKNTKSSKCKVQSVELQKSTQKLSNYTIPKKNSEKNRPITGKDLLSPNEEKRKSGYQSDNYVKSSKTKVQNEETIINVEKPLYPITSYDKLPHPINQNESQSYVTAQEIVEGDLELSEDEVESHITKQSEILNDKQNYSSINTISASTENDKKNESETLGNINSEGCQHILEPHMEKKDSGKIVKDVKKQKAKRKSPKRKDIKEHTKNTDIEITLEKSLKKKECTVKEQFANIDEPKIKNQSSKTKNNDHQRKDNISNINETKLIDKKVKEQESIMKEKTGNKDAPIDEPFERKEDELQTKELQENTGVVLASSAKIKSKKELSEGIEPAKNKDSKIKESLENTELAQKKGKGNKSKEPFENPSDKNQTNTLKTTRRKEKYVNENADSTAATKKSLSKKESKIKYPSENVKNTITINKPVRNRDKPNKTNELSVNVHVSPIKDSEKESKTKFGDLFGDSSSLISPEDLGLLPVTTVVPTENYVPICEDAQDASDLTTIRIPVVAAPMETTKDIVENTDKQGLIDNVASKPLLVLNEIPNNQDVLPLESAPAEAEIQNIYQNLQSVTSPKEDVLKTIIISTGVQPHLTEDGNLNANDNTSAELHVMQCVKPIMQALATSTPHKIWQQNVVPAEIDQKYTNSRCDSNESREASFDKTPVINKSDNNTVNSNTNDTDVPDVRIFVRRRRKVVKK